MQQREFDPDDLIITEGDQSDFVYEIISGEVEVFTQLAEHTVTLGTVKQGEFLGEMGIIQHQPRSASARAKTQVTALLLEKWEFLRLMSENPSSAYRLIHRLSERLREVNTRLAEEARSPKVSSSPKGDPPSQSESHDQSGHPTDKQETGNLRVTLLPASKQVTPYLPKEGLSVETFPFSVGRVLKPNESRASVSIDLSIPDSAPFRLSRQHFSLTHQANGYGVLDLGSTLGTEVNGEFLGGHFGKDFKHLEMGENTIIAGGIESSFIFNVRLEKN